MKKIVLVLSLLFILASCQSKGSLDLEGCKSLELSYLMGGPITIIEDEELNKVAALLEDYNEISIEDQDDAMSLKAINVLVYQDERSLSIMVYPDSSATITDPANNNTKNVRFSDDTYKTLAQYIDYDIDDLDLGS